MDKITISISLETAKWLYSSCSKSVSNNAALVLAKMLGNEELISSALKGTESCVELMICLAPFLVK